ncbi:MAG: hypothetical protein CL916_09255 [Deltaproteobacteria bacterium]|nr:hypothetical protein [Deltaproteobacteria bacterium]
MLPPTFPSVNNKCSLHRWCVGFLNVGKYNTKQDPASCIASMIERLRPIEMDRFRHWILTIWDRCRVVGLCRKKK